jgi:hypothetical protein
VIRLYTAPGAKTALCPSCCTRGPITSGACGRWLYCSGCGARHHITSPVLRRAHLRLVIAAGQGSVEERPKTQDEREWVATARDAFAMAYADVNAAWHIQAPAPAHMQGVLALEGL